MRVMSAGDGYKYLLRTVATGDGERTLSTPLTRYYAEGGTPPGRWIGSAVTALGGGALAVGDEVTEQQLQLLIGPDSCHLSADSAVVGRSALIFRGSGSAGYALTAAI